MLAAEGVVNTLEITIVTGHMQPFNSSVEQHSHLEALSRYVYAQALVIATQHMLTRAL